MNVPFTSIKLKSVTFVPAALTNPVAPLLAPSIWSDVDNAVIAVPTLISVKVFISNNLVSYLVVWFTKLADCALKSYNLARPISDPPSPLLLDIKETVAVVPIPKLGDPKTLFTNNGSPVEYATASCSTAFVVLGFGTSIKPVAIFSIENPFT